MPEATEARGRDASRKVGGWGGGGGGMATLVTMTRIDGDWIRLVSGDVAHRGRRRRQLVSAWMPVLFT